MKRIKIDLIYPNDIEEKDILYDVAESINFSGNKVHTKYGDVYLRVEVIGNDGLLIKAYEEDLTK